MTDIMDSVDSDVGNAGRRADASVDVISWPASDGKKISFRFGGSSSSLV
jgi:hypothetical protein